MARSSRVWFVIALPAQLVWGAPIMLALGASTAAQAAPPASEDPQELFAAGQNLAQTADYNGAIEAFEKAFRLLPDDLAYDSVRNRIRVELVNAHQKAHAVDAERQHLAKAQAIVEDYLGNLAGDQDRTWGLERREELAGKLEAHDAALAAAERERVEAEARKAEAEAEAARRETETRRFEAEAAQGPDRSADIEASRAKAKRFFIAGGVVGGLAIGTGVLMAVGFSQANRSVARFENEPAQRLDARSDVIGGNTLGGVGAALTGALLITSATLLVLGGQHNARAKSMAVAPILGPGRAGLSISGRF